MAVPPVFGLALCAGAGGLELGLKLAIPGYRAVGYVERDAYAAAALVARMADEALEPAPVWDDVATFDGRPWRGVVDLISAGYPCQPFSAAGRRRGTADPRHLWPHIARIIREIRPAEVFLENVPRHMRLGFDVVARELVEMGHQVAAGLFAAEEVRAAHRRERMFVLAYAEHHAGRAEWRAQPRGRHDPEPEHLAVPRILGRTMADAALRAGRLHAGSGRRGGAAADLGRTGRAMADAGRAERRSGTGRGDELNRDNAGRTEEAGRSRACGGPVADPERDRLERRESAARPTSSLRQRPTECRGAVAESDGCDGSSAGRRRSRWRAEPEFGGPAVADSVGEGREGRAGVDRDAPDECAPAQRDGALLADADGIGDHPRVGDLCAREPDTDRRGAYLPVLAPGPADPRWPAILAERPDLAPALEPSLRRMVDGLASGVELRERIDRLRLCGNGVVPLAAAVAYCSLRDRLEASDGG